MRKSDRELNKFVETEMPAGMMALQMNALDIFQQEELVHQTNLIVHCIRLHIF
jgi:hypothetical protein